MTAVWLHERWLTVSAWMVSSRSEKVTSAVLILEGNLKELEYCNELAARIQSCKG